MQIATDSVERAPVLVKWEFPEWERHFALMSVSDWTFVLLQYVGGGAAVLVCPSGPIDLDAEQRRYVLRVLMESELGESVLLGADVEFEMLDNVEVALRRRLRPIRELRTAFGMGD